MSNTKRESPAAYRARMKAHGTVKVRAPVKPSTAVMLGGVDPAIALDAKQRSKGFVACKGCGFLQCSNLGACAVKPSIQRALFRGVTIGIDLGFEKQPFSEASDRLRAMLPAPDASAMPRFIREDRFAYEYLTKPFEAPRFTGRSVRKSTRDSSLSIGDEVYHLALAEYHRQRGGR